MSNFYNQLQKLKETEDAFADELQILVDKTVACKPELLKEANQALKHQYGHQLRNPCFNVVAKEHCLASSDFESFTQFRGCSGSFLVASVGVVSHLVLVPCGQCRADQWGHF